MRSIVIPSIFLALTSICSANIIQNGDFENSTPLDSWGGLVLGTGNIVDLPNWAITGSICGTNCTLVLGTTYSEPSNVGNIIFQAQSGVQSVDITGSGNTNDGGLEQTVATDIGILYQLSFYVGNMDNRAAGYSQPSTIEVRINGVSQGLFSNPLNSNGVVNWALQNLSFVATANATTISFINATTGDNYAGLDNVVLNATPEPGTMLIGGLGLLGLALNKRRRVRK